MAKIGENALGNMAKLGLEELRAANAGAMAMEAPPVQPPKAPSYSEMLAQQQSRAPATPDRGISR